MEHHHGKHRQAWLDCEKRKVNALENLMQAEFNVKECERTYIIYKDSYEKCRAAFTTAEKLAVAAHVAAVKAGEV
jgi:hypothetical protein